MRHCESRTRILVTGGTGFPGSHLYDRLLVPGHEVPCVDKLFTGPTRNIEHRHDKPRLESMHHDLTFPLHVEAARARLSAHASRRISAQA